MALSSLRLRRTLSGLSTLHRSLSATTSTLSAQHSSSSPLLHAAESPASSPQSWTLLLPQSRTFRSSCLSSARSASYMGNDPKDEIGPDTILFEGCDYNHWLIVMDFPKEMKPSPEEMVRTYEETCAVGLNISVEEAKQKMYACSTTTYTGFQAVMTEQESEKFNGLPGVIFVLPDSYIDPTNKEYGGDKYINGTIIPRPPPVQYGRQGGRHRDRNRYPDPPRHDRQGPMVNHQGNPSYGQHGQGPMVNHQGNPSYGQHGQGPMVNHQGNPSYGQQGQGPMVNHQGNPSYGQHRQGPMVNHQGNPSYGQHGQGPMVNHQGNPSYGQQGQGPMVDHQGNPSYGQHGQGPMVDHQGNPSYGQHGQGPMVNHQGNPSYGQHGASQNYPNQNYGAPRQGENRGPIPVNTPGESAMHQPGRDPIPSYHKGKY